MNPAEIHTFARNEVFTTLADRYQGRTFSRDLWKKMAREGLFGLLTPPRFGGSDQGPMALIEAIEAFMQGGQDLGLCLSWLDHLLIHTHVISRFGSEQQKRKYLPGLVTGERIGALAASEPGTGAHPVKMKASAEKRNGTFRLTAHKLFITNGPVADSIIVLARTGPAPGKDGISALIFDTRSPGFRVKQKMDFGYLHTSPHGELLFEDCVVPAEDLLGDLGDGHVRISRAVFGWERFMGMVTLTAHFRLILDRTIRLLSDSGSPMDEKVRRLVAELHITLEGLGEFARGLACEVIERTDLDRRLTERLLFTVGLLTEWWELFERIRQGLAENLPFPLGILLQDARLLTVSGQLYELQKSRVAANLLEGVPKPKGNSA